MDLKKCALTVAAGAAVVALSSSPAAAAGARPAASDAAAAATATCSGRGLYGPATINWTMSSRARDTARAVIYDAKTCDKRGLVWRSTRDKTLLSLGLVTPSQAWATPDNRSGSPSYKRYADTVRALQTRPRTYRWNGATYSVWPRVAYDNTSGAWDEAVRSGLISRSDARQMQSSFGYYVGYRVYVTDGGRLAYAFAGE